MTKLDIKTYSNRHKKIYIQRHKANPNPYRYIPFRDKTLNDTNEVSRDQIKGVHTSRFLVVTLSIYECSNDQIYMHA